MVAAAICIVTMHFIWHRCVPNRGQNIPTEVVDNRSNDKQIEILVEIQESGNCQVECYSYLAFSTPCVYSVLKSQYPYQI